MSNLILIGFKACGKTSVGQHLAQKQACPFVDTDRVLEALYTKENGQILSCREIYTKIGKAAFRDLEKNAIQDLITVKNTVIATGGGIILATENRKLLRQLGQVIYLSVSYETLLKRIKTGPVPAFMTGDWDTEFAQIYEERESLYKMNADKIVNTESKTVEEIAQSILS